VSVNASKIAPAPSGPGGFRTFLILWATQSFSVLGSSVTFFSAVIWLTTVKFAAPGQQPLLAAALAAAGLAFALPNVFLAPIAGALTDRHDRRKIMAVTNFLNTALSLALMALLLSGKLELWMLITIVALFAAVMSFHGSAFDASYVMIVPRDLLPRANGMMQTMWALGGVLSPAVATAIISLPALARRGIIPGGLGEALGGLTSGIPLAVGLDALSFIVAGCAILFLAIPSPKRDDLAGTGRRRKTLWADVREGALYVWNRRPLLWLLGTFTVANFVTAPIGIIQPLLIKVNLALDWTARGFTYETALALLSTVIAAGGVAGGVIISTWGGLKRRRIYGVIVPLLVMGLAQVGFGLSSLLYLASAAGFILAAMGPMMNAHSQTIWQLQTPPELQGRVFSVRRVIAQCTMPLGTAVTGWAAGVFNPGVFVAVLGGVLVVFCLAQLLNPLLLKIEDRAFLEGLAAKRPATAEAAASQNGASGVGQDGGTA
jgi:DHA3 family macrolide efflux protein-like MFS transporter